MPLQYLIGKKNVFKLPVNLIKFVEKLDSPQIKIYRRCEKLRYFPETGLITLRTNCLHCGMPLAAASLATLYFSCYPDGIDTSKERCYY